MKIEGFSQLHRGEWVFNQRRMFGDTHKAILLNLEELTPCAHEKEKVVEQFGGRMQDTFIGYVCECGAEVEPAGFVEKKS